MKWFTKQAYNSLYDIEGGGGQGQHFFRNRADGISAGINKVCPDLNLKVVC